MLLSGFISFSGPISIVEPRTVMASPIDSLAFSDATPFLPVDPLLLWKMACPSGPPKECNLLVEFSELHITSSQQA